MNNLLDFLTDLAVNPKKQGLFEDNPNAVMDGISVSNKDKLNIKSGNKTKINKIFMGQLQSKDLITVVSGCTYADPGPDTTEDEDPFPTSSNRD